MTDDNNKNKDSSKNKGIKEIEIENKDLINVFFDKSSSQFESQLFLSRKRMLNAENGQTELSDLLKSKLKALDMMLFILSNNKNILKESDLSCCEVLNNLLCISKKNKAYGEHIYSKIKSVILYILKNQLFLNIDSNKTIIKFIITLLNIKFDNGYFKQILEIISANKDFSILFLNELFDKLFKGRNITIKLKEMKFILKSILLDEKMQKFLKILEIFEKILGYAHEKESGGCRTFFQLNQVIFLLQYLIDILNIKEIKNSLPEKEELNNKLLKIFNNLKISIEDLLEGKDYEKDKDKISKKELEKINERIKRKRIYFLEMNNLIKKIKNYFEKEIISKEIFSTLGDISNLYKNKINTKYNIVINSNDKLNKKEKKGKKNEEKNKEEMKKGEKENEQKEEENNKEIKNEEDSSDNENKNKKIKLDEEEEEKEKEEDEIKIDKKHKNKEKNNIKDNKDLKNKNKKKKIH